MGLVRGDGKEELPCAAEAILEGYLYKLNGSYYCTKTTVHTSVVVGVAESSSKDAFGVAKTLSAGDMASFYLPNCGKIVKVAMITGQTCHRGAPVYVAQESGSTYYGMADVAGGSAVIIGHYMGTEGLATKSNGQLVDVLLDCRTGQTQ